MSETLVPAAANASVNLNQVAGAAVPTGNGTAAGSVRVSMASDSTGQVVLAAGAATIGALTANQSVNVAQINGVATTMGNGISGTGVQRVTLASDSTGQVALAAGAATIGALTANQSVNAAQIGGTATVTGGVAGTLGVGGLAASGAAKAGNPNQIGGVFNTTQPTVTTGQAVELQATSRGAAIVATGADTFNVTVNAALPTGANVIGALSANQSVNVAQIGGIATLTGNGITGTGSQRVTIASDNTAFAVNATLSAETTKVIGTARVLGNAGGAFDAAQNTAAPANVLTVAGRFDTVLPTVASGSTAALETDASGRLLVGSIASALPTGSNVIGALSANQSENLNQVGGTAILTGNGVTGAGSPRVTIASDNTAFAVNATLSAETTKVIGTARVLGNAGAAFDAATGAAVPANAIMGGYRAATANPTNATGGNIVAAMGDKAGRLVVTPGTVRELVGVQTTNITTTTETTVVTAGAAGVFNDISSLVITNRTAAAVNVTIKDATAGTTRAIYDLASSGGVSICFVPPMPQAAAAANWTATLSVANTVDVNVVYVKNL